MYTDKNTATAGTVAEALTKALKDALESLRKKIQSDGNKYAANNPGGFFEAKINIKAAKKEISDGRLLSASVDWDYTARGKIVGAVAPIAKAGFNWDDIKNHSDEHYQNWEIGCDEDFQDKGKAHGDSDWEAVIAALAAAETLLLDTKCPEACPNKVVIISIEKPNNRINKALFQTNYESYTWCEK